MRVRLGAGRPGDRVTLPEAERVGNADLLDGLGKLQILGGDSGGAQVTFPLTRFAAIRGLANTLSHRARLGRGLHDD